MKTIIAMILCLSLASSQMFAETESKPITPKGNDPELTAIEFAVVMTISLMGLYAIIKVACRPTKRPPPQGATVNVVLQKSPDNVNWQDIATNRIAYDSNSPPIEIWRDYICQHAEFFYRVRVQSP